MRTLRLFLSVGAVVALLGLNVVVADIKSESAPLTYSLDTGSLTFDKTSLDEAQTVCAMEPGGSSMELFLQEPVIPEGPDRLTNAESMLAPASSLDSPPQRNWRNRPTRGRGGEGPPGGPESEPDAPSNAVPAPATVLIIGLGIGGVAAVAARRRWKKKVD